MERKGTAQYLSRLKRALSCSRADREKLLAHGKGLLDGFLEENPEGGYTALAAAFGPPEEFAGEMLATLDQEELKQTRDRRKLLQRAAALLAAVVLVLGAVFWYTQWYQLHQDVTSPYYSVPGKVRSLSPEEFKNLFGISPGETN